MIRPVVRDVFFLRQKSEPATREDLGVGRDLQDTLRANRDRCAGMAANMIGVKKRVIIVNAGFADVVMVNPVLLAKDTPYEAEEGCLSLDGTRKTTRWQNIEIEYTDDLRDRKTILVPRPQVNPTLHDLMAKDYTINSFKEVIPRMNDIFIKLVTEE